MQQNKVSNVYVGGQMKILSILTHFTRLFFNSVAFQRRNKKIKVHNNCIIFIPLLFLSRALDYKNVNYWVTTLKKEKIKKKKKEKG